MMQPKIVKIILGIVILGSLGWYFLKGYNHKITFKTKLAPSVVHDYLVRWDNFKKAEDSTVIIDNNIELKRVKQNYFGENSKLKINWSFKRDNDSITLVTAKITDVNNDFLSNFFVMNPKSTFYRSNVALIERFVKGLKEYSNTFKVGDIINESIPSKFCTYITISSSVPGKAQSMLNNISAIMDYIKGNNIQLDGNPFIEVLDWKTHKDSICYNFCFPIKEKDSLPFTNALKFKRTEERKALKTIFNGNYRDSDRAWLTLLDYADFNNIRVEQKPTEFFLNDPHMGTNSLEWKAEVYMPIQ